MESFNVKDVKRFMAKLLLHEDFDQYEVQEAEIVTDIVFKIDGHVQKSFYSEEEYEELGCPLLIKWKKLRPICYEIIKGKRTPVKFRFVLKLAEEELREITDGLELGFTRQDIGGLYLNIVFENGKLNCITGTSLNIFTMDKTLERVWDKRVAIELEGTEKDENINKA